ncbi:hypothetical protein HJG60_010326 [Phyllostomus discolor]|uniref:Uncharacterized protein n=1 Tax=Phyllostomus discolor TaxID=89673 RepID=A0A834EK88_9CHIR|nr:hypothetical protein HJG60_010326 [Phyllostomus discolor]
MYLTPFTLYYPPKPFPFGNHHTVVSVCFCLLVKPRSLHTLLSTVQNPKSYKALPSLPQPTSSCCSVSCCGCIFMHLSLYPLFPQKAVPPLDPIHPRCIPTWLAKAHTFCNSGGITGWGAGEEESLVKSEF